MATDRWDQRDGNKRQKRRNTRRATRNQNVRTRHRRGQHRNLRLIDSGFRWDNLFRCLRRNKGLDARRHFRNHFRNFFRDGVCHGQELRQRITADPFHDRLAVAQGKDLRTDDEFFLGRIQKAVRRTQ